MEEPGCSNQRGRGKLHIYEALVRLKPLLEQGTWLEVWLKESSRLFCGLPVHELPLHSAGTGTWSGASWLRIGQRASAFLQHFERHMTFTGVESLHGAWRSWIDGWTSTPATGSLACQWRTWVLPKTSWYILLTESSLSIDARRTWNLTGRAEMLIFKLCGPCPSACKQYRVTPFHSHALTWPHADAPIVLFSETRLSINKLLNHYWEA